MYTRSLDTVTVFSTMEPPPYCSFMMYVDGSVPRMRHTRVFLNAKSCAPNGRSATKESPSHEGCKTSPAPSSGISAFAVQSNGSYGPEYISLSGSSGLPVTQILSAWRAMTLNFNSVPPGMIGTAFVVSVSP